VLEGVEYQTLINDVSLGTSVGARRDSLDHNRRSVKLAQVLRHADARS